MQFLSFTFHHWVKSCLSLHVAWHVMLIPFAVPAWTKLTYSNVHEMRTITHATHTCASLVFFVFTVFRYHFHVLAEWTEQGSHDQAPQAFGSDGSKAIIIQTWPIKWMKRPLGRFHTTNLFQFHTILKWYGFPPRVLKITGNSAILTQKGTSYDSLGRVTDH